MESKDDNSDVVDDEPSTSLAVPDSGDTGEGGKLKMIVQLVKKCLGVKDIASMRLSLPASLLEPIPNLEYWHYLDRPDLFAAFNPFERMLAVLRFTFAKDLKFIHGKICKPYNSVLGEHFRSHWDFIPVEYSAEPGQPPVLNNHTLPTPNAVSSESSSVKSSKSNRSGISFMSKIKKSPSTTATPPDINLDAQLSNLSLEDDVGVDSREDRAGDLSRMRVVYTTEQISHHPPVSAYYASCPARSLELSGIDQITVKVATAAIRVSPGSFNKGIYVNITGGPGKGEMYHITHPVAFVNGILRGSFYLTVGDSSIVTCSSGEKNGKNFRAIIEYKEESWLGKANFLLEGVIHTYTEGELRYKEWTKIKDVPQSRIVAVFDGSWKDRIRWRRVTPQYLADSSPSDTDPENDYTTLLDLSVLRPIPKSVRPISQQLPYESRKLWENVTRGLLKKEFGDANKEKMIIEQRQRDEAAERKKKGVEYLPRYFEKNIDSGIPTLTAEGLEVVKEELSLPP